MARAGFGLRLTLMSYNRECPELFLVTRLTIESAEARPVYTPLDTTFRTFRTAEDTRHLAATPDTEHPAAEHRMFRLAAAPPEGLEGRRTEATR